MSITRHQFETELQDLRSEVLKMGNEADLAVSLAIQALVEHDSGIASDVIRNDDLLDNMDLEIESRCMKILALQQPIASDLRLIGTALKIITDLERIGDHAVDIAKVARKVASTASSEPFADFSKMSSAVRGMLKTALRAFVHHDLDLVHQVVEADDEVDRLFHVIRFDLHEAMQKDPEIVVDASYMLFVAHYLERMADHAVNIAERVYYMETGDPAQLAKSHKTGS